MKFYDKVKIGLEAGKGGNGIVTGRKEAKIPYGGPAGGDGGKGGDIYIICSKDENTLIYFRYNKIFKAQDGGNGMNKEKYGANGEDLILTVPIGTLVKDQDTGKILFQFRKDGEKFLATKGGKGGLGNIHFKNSTRQYPGFSLLGEPGEIKNIILELQLLGDVALIGTPSVGKSTIINAVSNVKAKTAEYHFTTITPNIGVVKQGNFSFNIVDVPGLISGASEGKGLGTEFLRHILKAQIFCFILDISRYENGINEPLEILEEIKTYIKNRFLDSLEYGKQIQDLEIKIYPENDNIIFEVIADFGEDKKTILKKLIYFVINKFDLVNDEEILNEYQNKLSEIITKNIKINKKIFLKNIIALSTFINYGVIDFLRNIVQKIQNFDGTNILEFDQFDVDKQEKDYIIQTTQKEIPYLQAHGYIQENEAQTLQVWEIMDREIAQYVYTLPWGNDEAENRFWETLSKKGILKILEKKGILRGDILKIKSIYPGYDDRYIMWD